MTDIIDKAAENEAVFLAEALYKARRFETVDASTYECEDCGDTIPEARRQAVRGCTRCVLCQEYFERGWP
ncbi:MULTISPECIES: TraR/DksA family transcriptional regulator [Neisseriaceae]|uniref:Phage associated protein n=2 Tax=Neisseriaceae TaxID=481 RepID=A0A378URI9_BERDE|nr:MULTISPECIES: TraR/DksA family transcriptional regulator [Neisseriaceae]QEY23520.1 TraR/DksA family transcriptional regulator [Neisseria animalis]ROW32120.1 TraR/DksA family transcriptional regulator [Neisseria animalis]STZ76075.1 phage associated protein [Bergeriella denitrificans]STZ77491.1 phage associated protein [Bergeriella denitrificans]STZ83051.1 phage associated protein [Bergeriella denitrificans]